MTFRLSGVALVALTGLLLSGCASTSQVNYASTQPETLTPITSGSVSSASLPPIGTDGQIQQPVTTAALPGGPALPGSPTQTAALPPVGPGGTVSSGLGAPGGMPGATGRLLAPGFGVNDLLGMWSINSGPESCTLNLTQTAKDGTARYRASTPGCQIAGLSGVSSWQLAGSQIQLYDDSNSIVGTLLLSGDRFIGTMAGGRGISMVG